MQRDRGFRRQQRERVIHNRKNLMRDTGLEHRKQEQENRYNKRHPYDCGNPQCLVCHSEKVFHEKTVNDLRLEEAFNEQVKEELEGD
jgi:hypothetical protein